MRAVRFLRKAQFGQPEASGPARVLTAACQLTEQASHCLRSRRTVEVASMHRDCRQSSSCSHHQSLVVEPGPMQSGEGSPSASFLAVSRVLARSGRLTLSVEHEQTFWPAQNGQPALQAPGCQHQSRYALLQHCAYRSCRARRLVGAVQECCFPQSGQPAIVFSRAQ